MHSKTKAHRRRFPRHSLGACRCRGEHRRKLGPKVGSWTRFRTRRVRLHSRVAYAPGLSFPAAASSRRNHRRPSWPASSRRIRDPRTSAGRSLAPSAPSYQSWALLSRNVPPPVVDTAIQSFSPTDRYRIRTPIEGRRKIAVIMPKMAAPAISPEAISTPLVLPGFLHLCAAARVAHDVGGEGAGQYGRVGESGRNMPRANANIGTPAI